MTLGLIFFLVLAVAAVVTAAGMLLSRNAVYAALFLILNFAAVAVIYLMLGAPFIAMAQVTVYAGAIMVLFLFVIMLLGAEKLSGGEPLTWQRPLAIVMAILLVAEGAYVLFSQSMGTQLVGLPPADWASPEAIGTALFGQYLLPFEITSILLLIALIGAVVLTRTEKK